MKIRSALPSLLATLCVSGVTAMPASSLACSMAQAPNELRPISSDAGLGAVSALVDAGVDSTPPARPQLSQLKVRLIKKGCDGSGATCPQLDTFSFRIVSSDDRSNAQDLRYIAAFADTRAAADTAPFTAAFRSDIGLPDQVTAHLGHGGRRHENSFDRATLCFAVAAVDQAGNTSERSESVCIDTVDQHAATTELINGAPCPEWLGCSAGGLAPGSFLVLLLAALLRRLRMGSTSSSHD